MRYLLDTSAILAHYRKETGWEAVQGLFEDSEAEILLASVTLAEFARRLVALSATTAEIDRTLTDYELLFSAIVEIDASIAKAAYAIGRASDTRLPLIDALIAAAAQRHDATLIHRDHHMAGIPQTILNQRYL